MRNSTKSSFRLLNLIGLGVGGYILWRNRFTIQRRLESIGIRTPLLSGSISETARSVAAKAGGRFDQGASIAESVVKKAG